MKIFLDTADVEAIRQASQTGLVDGVTTNPSHVLKSGQCFEQVVREICEIQKSHVSAEAVAETAAELVDEAIRISSIGPQVVVKIPMTPEGLKAVPVLEKEKGIRTNVTMVFSPTQALLAMKAGASFVSIVLSRLEAVGIDSSDLIRETMTIRRNYAFPSEIIAGSLKTQPTLLECLRHGVDIATIPQTLFDQLFQHPLTDSGIAQFEKDWQRVPKEGKTAAR